MRHSILLLFMLLLLQSLVQAQEISTKIMTISLDESPGELFFINDGKVESYVSSRSGLGRPFGYKGTRRFTLRSKPEEFALSKPPPPVVSVLLPSGADTVLLVSAKAENDQLSIRAFGIETQTFKAGDYKFFNFSNQDLVMICGNRQFGIRAGEDKLISDEAMKKDVIDVTVRIGRLEDGQAKQIYASRWGHQPVKRNFIFLFNGRHASSPVAIRRYSDRPK